MTKEMKDWLVENVAVDFSIQKKDDILEHAARGFGEKAVYYLGEEMITYVRSQRNPNKRSKKFNEKVSCFKLQQEDK